MEKDDVVWLGDKFQTVLKCMLKYQDEPGKGRAKSSGDSIHCSFSNLRLCFSVLSMAQAIYTDCELRLKKFNLTEGKFVLLFIMYETQGELSPHQLAEMAGVSRATVTGLLEGLENDGWIVREMQKSDRRRVTVKFTSWGSKQIVKAIKAHTAWMNGLFGGMPVAQQNKISDALFDLWKHSDAGVKSNKEVKQKAPVKTPKRMQKNSLDGK